MKQLFFTSTFSQIVTLAAGIDAGAYDTAHLPALAAVPIGADLGSLSELSAQDRAVEKSDPVSERILVVSNHSYAPELSTPVHMTPDARPLLSRFDRVIDFNATLHPVLPSVWNPQQAELPAWERVLRTMWDLGEEELELIVESPQVNPAKAIGRVFSTALQRVHADGLMSYGPTRNSLLLTNGQRMTSLHYLPYVEGVVPRLLSEFDAVPVPLDVTYFRGVVDELVEAAKSPLEAELGALRGQPTALVVGQYLAQLGLITDDDEAGLHQQMVREAASRGARHVVFKPHPAAPPAALEPLRRAAQEIGVGFSVFARPIIAEAVISFLQPTVVVGCFSTTLAVARTVYSIPAVAVGTSQVLQAITPFENSNRVPAVLCDVLMTGDPTPLTSAQQTHIQQLIDSVAYAARPNIVPHLRPTAERFLETAQHTADLGYFRRRRLTKLGLPGALPKKPKVAKLQPGGLRIEQRLPRPLRRLYRMVRRRLRSAMKNRR